MIMPRVVRWASRLRHWVKVIVAVVVAVSPSCRYACSAVVSETAAGSRYSVYRAAATIMPTRAINPNIHRHPRPSMRVVSSGPAMAVPSVEEELMIPVAVPRERTLNQSRTTRMPEGNCGASPAPSTTRAAMNSPNDTAVPAMACALDHTTMPIASSRRGPSLSTSAPTGSCATA
jgi:hypothetical protein